MLVLFATRLPTKPLADTAISALGASVTTQPPSTTTQPPFPSDSEPLEPRAKRPRYPRGLFHRSNLTRQRDSSQHSVLILYQYIPCPFPGKICHGGLWKVELAAGMDVKAWSKVEQAEATE